MSRSATWMPLYIGDYLADTGHLTAQQHGSYLLMLMHQWRTGPLPKDERQLAAIARVDLSTWRQKIAPSVMAFFSVTVEGLTQGRLAREKQKSDANLLSKSEAGQRGAEGRWAKPHSERNGERMADASVRQWRTDGPSPSPSEKKDSGSLRSPATQAVALPDLVTVNGVLPARDQLWGPGLASLQAMTGLPGKRCRALLGKLTKIAKDNCAMVSSVLEEAAEIRPVGDPIAWITAALHKRVGSESEVSAFEKMLGLDQEQLR